MQGRATLTAAAALNIAQKILDGSFTPGYQTASGGTMSNTSVKEAIMDLVKSESGNSPLSALRPISTAVRATRSGSFSSAS